MLFACRKKFGEVVKLSQDEDVLDTWFRSVALLHRTTLNCTTYTMLLYAAHAHSFAVTMS
jgi:valyl-tRNA synthetase